MFAKFPIGAAKPCFRFLDTKAHIAEYTSSPSKWCVYDPAHRSMVFYAINLNSVSRFEPVVEVDCKLTFGCIGPEENQGRQRR
jgi:hypothetical protein